MNCQMNMFAQRPAWLHHTGLNLTPLVPASLTGFKWEQVWLLSAAGDLSLCVTLGHLVP